jgi:hypothetical protein
LDCLELNGITAMDKLLFLGTQAFPCFAGVAITEQFIPIEKVVGRYRVTVRFSVESEGRKRKGVSRFQGL